ncbi:ras GTPase-activating protein 1-like [Argopecten irradians]|uniref:ras GTPase-activating protein 1-like n=1 Tax=Argopecten irradians TaxID=31199 RepID=UPI00371DFD27
MAVLTVQFLLPQSNDSFFGRHWYKSEAQPDPSRSREKAARPYSGVLTSSHTDQDRCRLHPYCIVSLNNVRVCRTQVEEGTNPMWDDKFILDDIPCDIEDFSITICNHSRRTKDQEIANITIPVVDVKDTDCYDKWHMLQALNPAMRSDTGSLRIRARYLHEIIMPEEKYLTLKELILNGDLSNILELFNLCGNDRIPVAKALLQIFSYNFGKLGHTMASIELCQTSKHRCTTYSCRR